MTVLERLEPIALVLLEDIVGGSIVITVITIQTKQ